MSRGRVPTPALVIVCAALVAASLAMAFQSLALAGDGAFYLLRIIATGEVFGTQERYLGNLVRQAPALLGVHAGVTNTYALSLLFGVGQIVFLAVVWSLAIVLSRADRVAFTAVAGAAGICAGTTWFFSVSEAVFATSLTALVAVLLWREGAWTWAHAIVALVASFVLVATYEAAFVTGALLAAWAGWRAYRATPSLERYACAAVAALSTLSVLVAAQGIREPTSPAHSRSLLYSVTSLDPWPLYLATAGLALFVAGMRPWLPRSARWALLGLGATALGIGAAGLDISTQAAFAARGGASLVVFALQLALLLDWATRGRTHARGEPDARLLAIPILFVVAILVANGSALRSWSGSLDAFQREVEAAAAPTDAHLVLPANRRDVLWNWTIPSLSLLVRTRPDASVLFVPYETGYVPFAPEDARSQIDDAYTWGR